MTELLSMRKTDSPLQVETPLKSTAEMVASYSAETKEFQVNLDKPLSRNSIHYRHSPINLKWNDISYTTKDGKAILHSLSGNANAGELTAIMGPSGAGKSTVLNILSGFTRSKMSGSITVNGAPRNMRTFRSCYILQDNHLLPRLTVRESIQMAAKLKIPSSVSRQDREKAVEDCIETLGLLDQQHNRANQLSGGQRKRVCIAQELVSNPSLIFLDEPTSGLDSSSCLQCILLLKSFAEEGRTVICTIHQPSARIFELFDNLYMLAEGQCIYRGSIKNLIPFLSKHGLSCPTYHNPADFVTEVASGEHGNWIEKLKTGLSSLDGANGTLSLEDGTSDLDGGSELGYQASTNNLMEEEMKNKTTILKNNALESSSSGYATSSWNQLKVLTYRSLLCTLREPMATLLRFLAYVMMGLLIGALYYGIGNDANQVFSNLGYLFFSLLILIYTSMMPTLLTFPLEKTIFTREYINSWYSTQMYFLAKTLAEIPFQMILPAIFCGILYWMTGQPYDLARFGLYTLTCILSCLLAQSSGLILGAATSVQNAVFLAPVATVPPLLFSGFFISLKTIPYYLQWLTYLSYIRYCFQNMLLAIYGLSRPSLDCDEVFCFFHRPGMILSELGMTNGNLCINFAAMLVFFIVFRAIAYCILYFRVIYKR